MFASAELGRKLSKEDFLKEESKLRTELLSAQSELYSLNFPVILLVGGVDGAGKGETVNLLLEWMDPRFVEVNAFGEPSDEERERPPFWKYWRALPPRGKIGIFYGSWYTDPIVQRVSGQMKQSELDKRINEIIAFEKLQIDEGALVLKIWLHLSKKAQKRRLEELEDNPLTKWRVGKQEWKYYKRYEKFMEVDEAVLRPTSTDFAPWHVIEGEDARYRSVAVVKLLIENLKAKFKKQKSNGVSSTTLTTTVHENYESTILNTLDLTKKLEKKKYHKKFEKLQGELNILAHQAKEDKISTVIVFEGFDAGGKGGAIRHLISSIDARNYRIIPVAAPTEEERRFPYLWRFWRHMPRAGQIRIFDRSWYGRVLVERVEGFASENDWRRAYSEINDFESQLVSNGIIVIKFWLHISKDEQLRRFNERKNITYKQYKITKEDLRNRKKWKEYETAVTEMIDRTSTDLSPWVLIEANDKYWARIKIMKAVRECLEKKIEHNY